MNSSEVIIYMIIGCAVFVGFLVFSGAAKGLLKFFVRGGIGVAAIAVVNIFAEGFGMAVGVNVLSAFIVGILGVPGFLTLYAAKFIL